MAAPPAVISHLRFQVMTPEADRGEKASGSESNSVIRFELRFPFDSSSTPYYKIADLSMAEIRLLLGSSSSAYIQLFQWANEPSTRPAGNEPMVVEETQNFNITRPFLLSYPNTMLSNLDAL
jgi:hypothetical protein|tara:strand:+ start:802 stop:1167 length:366 start_codon:yes stop_codon:yes gene_type:complete